MTTGWDSSIADPMKEKHALLIVQPRLRWTGWTNHSGNIWKVAFPHGYVTRLWDDAATPLNATTAIADVIANSFYYDHATQFIYAYSVGDPDSNTYAGLTVEFEIHVSDQAFIGPRDPLSAASQNVRWIPALEEIPVAQVGARDSIYGFLPLNSSALSIKNNDGWLNEILYAASFYRCGVKAYILANEDLYDGVVFSEVKQVFTGYTAGMTSKWPTLQIQCTDSISFFDKEVTLRNIPGAYPAVDPAVLADRANAFLPRLWGILERYKPINVDFDPVPATNNNRVWITHARDQGSDGSGTDGTLTYTIDTLGANSNTRTYFTTTPKVRIGDSMVIQRSGVNKYVFISNINRASKYVDHDSTGGGSVSGGDTATRYFIGRIDLQDTIGNVYSLKGGRDYTVLVDDVNNVRGFTMIDNVESGFLETPFDPSSWKISCTVYGRVGGDSYGNADPVGTVVDNGGVSARSINAIFHLLSDSLFPVLSELSTSQFQAVESDSYAIGLVIPSTRDALTAPTYLEVLNQLLSSNMYKIAICQDSSALKLGITQVAPFPGSGDYSAGELNHRDLEFAHDYANVYSDVSLTYNRRDVRHSNEFSDRDTATATTPTGPNLHLIKKTFTLDTLISSSLDAQELADRFAFLLGERRGFWTLSFELPYVDKSNIGATYRISRQHMPGFPYVENTQREQELIVSEVNKNSRSVSITLEDQKGVQDNSASW